MPELRSSCCDANESALASICSDCKSHADFIDLDNDEVIRFTDGTPVEFDENGIISIPSTEIRSIPLSWAMEARI